MCHLVLVLLAVGAGYAGAASIERCCTQKMVGGLNYTLVEAMDTSSYGCDWDCIYEEDNGKRTCFKVGGKAVVCDEEAQNIPCNICLFGYCQNCLYPCNEYGGDITECHACISDDCPNCLPQCGFPPIADEGTETVVVPEYPRCETCLIEHNCTNCSEPCSYYGNATECYKCVNADCPDCLYPCGFTPIADIETTGDAPGPCVPVNEWGKVKANTDSFGTYFGSPNYVPNYPACETQCHNNKAQDCVYWTWGDNKCWMFTSNPTHSYYKHGWVSAYRCQNEGE